MVIVWLTDLHTGQGDLLSRGLDQAGVLESLGFLASQLQAKQEADLRNVGALDDSDPQRLSVIIPNFLSGPSNCETPSNFYSVCCIDECEHLLSQVEVVIARPSAIALRLVEVISELQSGTVVLRAG